MYKFCILLLVLFVPFCMKGQNPTVALGASKNIVISGSVGYSVPFGKYAYTDKLDTGAGYAHRGINYMLSFSWKFIDNMGIAACAGGMAHGMDLKSADKLFYPASGTVSWNNLGQFYGLNYYMAGLYFNDWAGDDSRFSMNARALYGIMQMNLPALNLTGNLEKGSVGVKMNALTANTKGFLFGLGGKIILTKSLAFVMHVDYILSQFDFGNQTYEVNQNGARSQNNIHLNLHANVFNYSAGLGIMLYSVLFCSILT